MALAIKHIHDRKILHRDLKTQNIFMNQNGQIKIGDFGIARVLQHTYDCAQTAIGTPYYLSPEICQEHPYNQKSDIWSLGCILYEMCTLRHAFDANSMKGLVLKILRSSYPAIPSHYSEDLKLIIQEMLIKDPVKRPSMRKILEREFLAKRISKLLTQTITKDEFTDTFVQRHLEPHQIKAEGEEEESKCEINSVESSIIAQQKKMSKEAAARKKKKMEIVGQEIDDEGQSNLDVSESRERVPAIKEIDQN
jgi:NIMA (never in mitosis gene a)-related kinase